MDDRELLEQAAKAAEVYKMPSRYYKLENSIAFGPECLDWNPFNDDGDAFRLAVKLKLMIDHTKHAVHVGTSGDDGEDLASEPVVSEIKRDRATRRAVVRAAAEVGKGMLSHDEFVIMFPGRFEDEVVERAAAEIGKTK